MPGPQTQWDSSTETTLTNASLIKTLRKALKTQPLPFPNRQEPSALAIHKPILLP